MALTLAQCDLVLVRSITIQFTGSANLDLLNVLDSTYHSVHAKCSANNSKYTCFHNPRQCRGAAFRFVKKFKEVVTELLKSEKERNPGQMFQFVIDKDTTDKHNPVYNALLNLNYSHSEIQAFIGHNLALLSVLL